MMDKVYNLTSEIMDNFSDLGHNMSHINAVLFHLNEALKYNTVFKLNDEEIKCLKYAVIMHDIDDHKLTDTHETLENAKKILYEINETPDNIKLILNMIKWVSCSSNLNNNDMCKENHDWWKLWPRIVDRLEAIGKIGIWRAWIYSIKKDNPMHTEDTPLPTSEEELNRIILDKFNRYTGKSNSFIDHFYDKLLHIANIDSPEVQSNKYLLKVAKERHQIMVNFILDYSKSKNKDEIIYKYIC